MNGWPKNRFPRRRTVIADLEPVSVEARPLVHFGGRLCTREDATGAGGGYGSGHVRYGIFFEVA